MDAAIPSAQEPQRPRTRMVYNLKLYTANFVPDATTTAVLNALVHEESKELDALEEQTSRLHAKLMQLEKDKARLLETRHVHQAFLAPIRKVPAEILGMIFTHSLPEHSSVGMSLLLGRVCRRWKHVAVGTPQLWTALLVESSSPRMDPRVLIGRCLEYSGSLPLTLFLSGGGENWSGESGKSAMQMIYQNVHRVECISGIPGPLFWKILATQDTPIHAPLLKTVEICWDILFNLPRPIRPNSIIRAPNVVSIVLDLCGHLLPVFYSEPGKLRRLTLTSAQQYQFPPFIAILSRASNLQTLDIDLTSAVLRPGGGPLPTYLHSLQELSMTIQWDTDIEGIFQDLRTPSLERLTLVSSDDRDPVDVRTLEWLFLDGSPGLRELTLKQLQLDSLEFTSFVSELPTLESLCLSECGLVDGETLLYSLTLDPSVSRMHWLCPRLNSIILKYTEVDGGIIVKLVHSRAPLAMAKATSADRRLRTFHALECPGITATHTSALRDLEKDCVSALELDVVMYDPPPPPP